MSAGYFSRWEFQNSRDSGVILNANTLSNSRSRVIQSGQKWRQPFGTLDWKTTIQEWKTSPQKNSLKSCVSALNKRCLRVFRSNSWFWKTSRSSLKSITYNQCPRRESNSDLRFRKPVVYSVIVPLLPKRSQISPFTCYPNSIAAHHRQGANCSAHWGRCIHSANF